MDKTDKGSRPVSRTGTSRIVRRTAAVAAALLALTAVAAPAGAATAPRRDVAPGAQRTPDTLPVIATFVQRANADPQLVRFPLPTGVVPTQVSAQLDFDAASSGFVTVLTDGRQVARVEKPATVTSRHLSFPVSDADVVDGYLQFALKYSTGPVADASRVCISTDEGNAQLSHIVVSYAGQEKAPTTLAQFFGSSVTDVSIVTPRQPTAEVAAAALAASAAISHRYSRGVHVTVTTPDDATRATSVDQAGGRQVLLKPGPGPATATIADVAGVHTLTLSGDPSHLAGAAAALGSPLLSLAEVTTAAPLTSSGHRAPRTSLTLADLGQPSPSVQGIGQSQFSVNVRQSDFATSVRSATLHLVGQHTAVPGSISALVQYLWNGRLIGSEVLGNDTKVDETITIPASKMQVSNTLTVQLNAIPTKVADGSGSLPAGFGCTATTSTIPISLNLDGGASTIKVQAGHADDPGFSRFPQVLGNVLTVALANGSADTLTDAAGLVSELQFANTAQLDIRLQDARSFIDSSAPGLLAGATAAQLNDLRAPLRMASFRSIDQDDVTFGAGVDAPFAALQAWYQNGRDLLTLSSWSPDTSGTTAPIEAYLVTSLADSPYGWPALYDNVYIAQSTSEPPVLISSNAIVPQAEQLHQFNSYLYWVIGFVAVVVLMYVIQLVARRRLRRRAAALVDAQQASDADAENTPEDATDDASADETPGTDPPAPRDS